MCEAGFAFGRASSISSIWAAMLLGWYRVYYYLGNISFFYKYTGYIEVLF